MFVRHPSQNHFRAQRIERPKSHNFQVSGSYFQTAYTFKPITLSEQILKSDMEMEVKKNYGKPQCEVMELVEQSVLCSSATDVNGSISDPWDGLTEEEW